MNACLRRLRQIPSSGLAAALLVSILAIGTAAGQVQGILAPLSTPCGEETHRIIDVCTGEEHPVMSSSLVLDAVICENVQADGPPTGSTCEVMDLSTVVPAALACPIEVGTVDFEILDPEGTVLLWPFLPCVNSYQVIRGVIGRPVLNWCDATHPCAQGFYCDRRPGACDSFGTCKAKPPACTTVFDPVCGCDGSTHGNSCEAAVAGVSVACDGVCPCAPACTYDEGCLDVGPVTCRATIPGTHQGIQEPEVPLLGQAYFYLVRAKGRGAIDTTTYGFTSDGLERLFEGPGCP